MTTPEQALAQWQAGTSLASLARGMGLRRRELKKHFIRLLGSKAAVNAARAAGAGARGPTRRDGTVVTGGPPNDSVVPVWEGDTRAWRSDRVTVAGYREVVLIAPDGNKYVTASGKERADLLVPTKQGHLRLRLWETSHVAKAARTDEKLVATRKAQRAAKRQGPAASVAGTKRRVRRKG